jgi:hypothetical protein
MSHILHIINFNIILTNLTNLKWRQNVPPQLYYKYTDLDGVTSLQSGVIVTRLIGDLTYVYPIVFQHASEQFFWIRSRLIMMSFIM